MDNYHIIDEPKIKLSDGLIVNPLIILFAAILIPLIWNPPLLGRLWMPFVWLIANSYFLGSPTFKREVVISILGILAMVGLFFVFGFLKTIEPFHGMKSFFQYMMIFLNGTFFFVLYQVVFRQSVPYEIFSYLKESRI